MGIAETRYPKGWGYWFVVVMVMIGYGNMVYGLIEKWLK